MPADTPSEVPAPIINGYDDINGYLPVAIHDEQMAQLAAVVAADGTIEQSIDALLEKVRTLNAQLPCAENLQILMHLQQARSWQESRNDERVRQRVAGSQVKHDGPHTFVCTGCGARTEIHVHE